MGRGRAARPFRLMVGPGSCSDLPEDLGTSPHEGQGEHSPQTGLLAESPRGEETCKVTNPLPSTSIITPKSHPQIIPPDIS